MRVVIRRTGLSPDLLRAWERRYGVVEPTRSEGGQRLYSDQDVERLGLLARATGGGRSIGGIARLSIPELQRLIAQDEAGRARATESSATRQAAAAWFLGAAIYAVEQLDAPRLEVLLRRSAMQLSATTVIDDVLIPLLREIGERWHRGELSPAHEHLGSVVVSRALDWMATAAIVTPNAPTLIVATPAHQRHELGAKVVAVTASDEGWRVVFLGADLPADAIATAARQSGADVVALSLIYPTNEPSILREIRTLRELLGADVKVVAGGTGAGALQPGLGEAGVQVVTDLPQFRILLRSLHPSPPPYR